MNRGGRLHFLDMVMVFFDLQLVPSRLKYPVSRGAQNGYLEILCWAGLV